jgi:hypothetical protein
MQPGYPNPKYTLTEGWIRVFLLPWIIDEDRMANLVHYDPNPVQLSGNAEGSPGTIVGVVLDLFICLDEVFLF